VAAPHGAEGPIYPGTCRTLTPEQRKLRLPVEHHCWRLDMTVAAERAGRLRWQDDVAGIVTAAPESQGDVVLARKDAPVSYHLAVTVDDAAQGVTDVVRGVDLFEATHIHRLLQALLGLPTPRYRHHPLLLGPDGKRLAKRTGAPSLADLRAAGVAPISLAAELRGGRMPVGFGLAEA
jgi:glutamyl-Q tRNA(Asp) synthetase